MENKTKTFKSPLRKTGRAEDGYVESPFFEGKDITRETTNFVLFVIYEYSTIVFARLFSKSDSGLLTMIFQ